MNKQTRRIFLFVIASLAILGLVLISTGTVSAYRGSPNCWGEKKDPKSGQEYRDYIMKIRGTSSYEYIPCTGPNCGGSKASKPKPKPKNKDRDKEDNKPKKPKKKPNPTPVPCTPTYAPPTLTGRGQDPPYPLTMGQDPDKVGVDLTYAAQGGARTGSCNRGSSRSPITAFEIVSVELTSETVAWITGELAALYPGAKVKDTYPFVPTFDTSGTGTSSASLTAHIDPLDPGDYAITVRAVQEDGQAVVEDYSLKVWLLEAAITGP